MRFFEAFINIYDSNEYEIKNHQFLKDYFKIQLEEIFDYILINVSALQLVEVSNFNKV